MRKCKLALQMWLLEASLHKIGQHKSSCWTTSIISRGILKVKNCLLNLEFFKKSSFRATIKNVL
jgi:hypothetical protein